MASKGKKAYDEAGGPLKPSRKTKIITCVTLSSGAEPWIQSAARAEKARGKML